MDDKKWCDADDMRVEVVGTVRVDRDGQPADGVLEIRKDMDVTDRAPYLCLNCDNLFDTWQEAVEHLEGQQ